MPSLDALQRQITTAQKLQSVVKTMKVLAAVSIRQYEQAVESLAEYTRTIEMGLQVLLREQYQELLALLASMQLAEKNIEERLVTCNTQFQQKRQAAITEEILEIVAGSEALGRLGQ